MKGTIIFISLIMLTMQLSGQHYLSGKILDQQTGNPLSGAHVRLENTKYGAITDYSGYFSISGLKDTIYYAAFTYIGYEPILKAIIFTSQDNIYLEIKLNPKPYLAEEAIVTANRIEVSRNITPITVSLVSRQDIENDGESNLLPVLGKQVPGLFVTERGISGFGVADGAAGSISIRGIGGSPNTQVLVLIDGHPQFMGLFGHPLPDAYTSSDAEKAEVIRGPASILYGSNAMGGVINIISRQLAQDGVLLKGRVEYGSYNTFRFNGAAGFRKNKLQAYISYNKDKSDGHRENSDFNMDNIYSKLSFDLNSHFKVWAEAGITRYGSTNPGPIGTTDTTFENPTHYQAIERGYFSVTAENTYRKAAGALKAYGNWGNHTLAYDDYASSDLNYGLLFYQALKLFQGNTITAGYDFARYGGYAQSNIYYDPVKFIDTTVMESGIYLLAQQVFKDRFTLSAGLRMQYHQLFREEWIPQFGASYQIRENTRVRINISKGFRSPTIRELFMFKPANPELEPEKMWSYEAGWLQKLLSGKLSAELTVFYARGSNLIETIGVFPDIRNQNTGSFEHYGIEFQGKYLVIENLDVMVNYAWLQTDKPVLAAPKNQLDIIGNYSIKGFSFNMSMQYINQLTTRKEPLEKQSYVLLSARTGYTLDNLVTFYIDAENLLDQSYEINYGYPMPGISVMAGIQVKWQSRKK